MTNLTNREMQLAEQLLLMVKNGEKSITYGDLAKRVSPPMNPHGMGIPLESVCILCHDLELPLLTALVVSKTTGLPSDGFDVLLKRFGKYIPEKTSRGHFNAEIYEIYNCRSWDKLVNQLNLNIVF